VKTVSILGAGRLGGALALALSDAGCTVDKLIFRTKLHDELLGWERLETATLKLEEVESIGSEILIVCTADPEIESATRSVASLLAPGTVVLHTSGSLSSEVLSPASENGNPTGSLHPLVSVSSPRAGAASFKGAYFCIEGSADAASAAEEIAGSLGGRSFSIATSLKPLYHASAVLASGHLVALFQTALEALSACGLDRQTATDALLPLVESSVKNLSFQPPSAALTGPFARTDLEAIERHLAAFEKADLGGVARVYLELGTIALELAESNNAPPAAVEKIRERIKLAQALSK